MNKEQKGYDYSIFGYNNTMPQDTKIQVPITQKLKKGLKDKAEKLGFSSVNEAVRLLLQNFVNGNITIQFVQPSTELVDMATEKRIEKSLKEIEDGEFDLLDFAKDPEALKKILSKDV